MHVGTRTIEVQGMLAALLVFFLPIRALTLIGSGSLNLGVMGAIIVLPITIGTLQRYHGARLLIGILTLALLTAPLLSSYSSQQGRAIDASSGRGVLLFLSAAVVTLAALLWARTQIGPSLVAASFAGGGILNAAISPELWSTNAWKYAFALPVAVLMLALGTTSRRRMPTIVSLAALAIVTVRSDYRSLFGFLLVVGILYSIGNRKYKANRIRFSSILLLAVLVVAVYQGVVRLSLEGHLGERNQIVTSQQIAGNRSLIATGRPEWNATIPLFLEHPAGFGPGVIPLSSDVNLAKTGLARGEVNPNSTYVDRRLLGDRIELHSVAADMWVEFGILGLAAAATMLAALLQGVIEAWRKGRPTALELFVVVVACWDLFFSPIGSNLPYVILALGITLPLARTMRHETDDRAQSEETAHSNSLVNNLSI